MPACIASLTFMVIPLNKTVMELIIAKWPPRLAVLLLKTQFSIIISSKFITAKLPPVLQ